LDANPELAGKEPGQMADMGSSVSVMPLPESYQQEVDDLFKKMASYKETIEIQKEKIAGLEKDLSETKAKLSEAQGYKAKYESLEKEGEQMINTAKSKIEDMNQKVDDLLAKIEEVKKHGVVTAAPGAEGAEAPAGAQASQDSPGEVADDFGFGTQQADESFGF
jgi:DNA repair exonuclease SbcCD ATPase subunit